ncbi:azurin [Luteimonas sp. A277]
MKVRLTLLALSCSLALAACGGDGTPADADRTTPADTAAMDTTPMDTTPAEPVGEPTAAGGHDDTVEGDALDRPYTEQSTGGAENVDEQAANSGPQVADCAITIEGNDRMQYNTSSIDVPASCSEFTINLNHVGSMPVLAMGHNVVVTSAGDFTAVAADGLAAGADADYVKPDDARVIAATEMVGGGESTSVTFSTSSLTAGPDYTFFCSFPGHSALMRGTLTFGS